MEHEAYLETVRSYFADDLFAMKTSGIRIVDAKPGSSVVAVTVDERHHNAKGGVMGGLYLTMADFASAIADWDENEINMTVSSSMQFTDMPRGNELIATCTAKRRGRTMGFYDIDIQDAEGRLVAHGAYSLMHRPLPTSN